MMSNELLVVFYILLTLAFAYLWFYPKVVGERVKLMAWMDVVVTGIPVAISALLFWESDPTFRLLIFDLNWFFFTLLAMFAIELPIFLLYLRARGLNEKYWAMFRIAPKGSPDAAWASASVESVEKQLNDTRWDGLRTNNGRKFLLIVSNLLILFGTGFLLLVGDDPRTLYGIIHILVIFVFWFLLRQSVRLVADAPEEALDEMLLKTRNRSYVIAYRWLTTLVALGVTALMIFAVIYDSSPGSDGFYYQLNPTWPQVQAVFWFYFAYMLTLPSMAMISLELKRDRSAGKR